MAAVTETLREDHILGNLRAVTARFAHLHSGIAATIAGQANG